VVAFEPITVAAKALAETARLNNLLQIEIVPSAVSDRAGRTSSITAMAPSSSPSGQTPLRHKCRTTKAPVVAVPQESPHKHRHPLTPEAASDFYAPVVPTSNVIGRQKA
jgi:FkbM family methyltransferase